MSRINNFLAELSIVAPVGHCLVLTFSKTSETFRKDAGQRRAVEYKDYFVRAFQREPGKWRASVKRLDGKPIMLVGPGRKKLEQFVTGMDSLTPKDALRLAMAAIDADAFSRRFAVESRNHTSRRSVGSALQPRRPKHPV
jgi:hypothetical protein